MNHVVLEIPEFENNTSTNIVCVVNMDVNTKSHITGYQRLILAGAAKQVWFPPAQINTNKSFLEAKTLEAFMGTIINLSN